MRKPVELCRYKFGPNKIVTLLKKRRFQWLDQSESLKIAGGIAKATREIYALITTVFAADKPCQLKINALIFELTISLSYFTWRKKLIGKRMHLSGGAAARLLQGIQLLKTKIAQKSSNKWIPNISTKLYSVSLIKYKFCTLITLFLSVLCIKIDLIENLQLYHTLYFN